MRWTALNGAKGCKSVARHVAPENAGLGEGGGTCTRGGMIRTHCTRQTAITNSTPPVGDNYRAGRERLYTRAGGARRCLPRIKVAEDPDRL